LKSRNSVVKAENRNAPPLPSAPDSLLLGNYLEKGIGSDVRGVETVLSDFDGVRVARFSWRISLMVSWDETVSGWNAAENDAIARVTIVANAQFASHRYSIVYDESYLRQRLYEACNCYSDSIISILLYKYCTKTYRKFMFI